MQLLLVVIYVIFIISDSCQWGIRLQEDEFKWVNGEENPRSIKRVSNEDERPNADKTGTVRVIRDTAANDNETKIIQETEIRILKSPITNVTDSKIETCGGIFTQPQFIIETPNYPSNYPNGLDCLFIFKGPVCQTNYSLQFLDFNVQDTIGCTADRLEIKYKDALCGIREGIKNYLARNGILELNFISNANVSARGFRILVSRSACLSRENGNETGEDSSPRTRGPNYPDGKPIDDEPNIYRNPEFPSRFPNNPYLPPVVTNPPYPSAGYPAKDTPYLPAGHPAKERPCCASTYSAKRFYISSPGFPQTHDTATDCTFTIYRANSKVCRARIHLHYFSIGEQDQACTKGYLQIDGKLLCGCRTGMKLLSPFDHTFGNTKVFRFKNIGLPSNFAIEVIQDECPERYLPSEPKAFNFYHDQVNRIAWPNITHEEFLMKADNTEYFEPIDLGFKSRVVKHVYYFDSPNFFDDAYDISYSFNKPRDVEETTYLDTSDLSFTYPNSFGGMQCGIPPWAQLSKDVLWQRMPKCNELNVYPEQSKCKDYNFIKGYFQSPGYPYYYPKNINVCYRFSKQRGFCKIRLIMLDFQVDQSYDCGKDYLLINGNFRYCGQSLANTFTLFDMIGKNHEEIKFITDGQNSGRGFRGIYEQIPCSEGGREIHPHPHHNHNHHHVHTTLPPLTAKPIPDLTTPPSPPPSDFPCSRTIIESYFTIDVYDYGKDTCDFVVRKNKDNVCRLEIAFRTFDLSCESEHVLIKDDKFCGQLSGQEMTFEFEEDEISIKYKRMSLLSRGTGLKLHLVGRQISENCIVKLPPAQRILISDRRAGKNFHDDDDKNSTRFFEVVNDNSVRIVFQKKLKEVCGVVLESKDANVTLLCGVLIDSEARNCSSVSDRAVYVPYNKSDKLELKFKNAEMARKVEFKEITCDNKFIL